MLRRKPDSHKGSFGHVLILAGSARYSGAAVLCSAAAMRSGAGMVTIGIPKSLNAALIKIKYPEVMTLPLPETKSGSLALSGFVKIEDFIRKRADVLAIGPGLTAEPVVQGLIRRVVKSTVMPVVLDADGLNAFAGKLSLLRAAAEINHEMVLTPHPGEMAGLLGCGIKKVQASRKDTACKFAARYGVTLVLKGDHTIVADYEGNCYINKTGNAGMSTAGSGDVLSGMIAAFLGQGLDVFAAAKYAVYLHGLAGDLAAKEKTQISLIATDIIGKIPQAIKRCS
ncbi:MAG: NAD(P)H-hydrate dehydratase [Candidatus Omnitrophota bacterium]